MNGLYATHIRIYIYADFVLLLSFARTASDITYTVQVHTRTHTCIHTYIHPIPIEGWCDFDVAK